MTTRLAASLKTGPGDSGDQQRRETVLQVIRSARERLLISVFRCTDVAVLDAIGEALNRKWTSAS